jgi:hypothetical protein
LTGGLLEKTPFEMAEIAARIAPRPLLTVAPLHDRNIRVEGVRECKRALEPLYRLLAAEECLAFDFPDAGHTFPPASRKRAYAWFDRRLKQRS